MALEPNSIQRDRMLAHGKTKLILVQFLVGKDPRSINEYLSRTRQFVHDEKGQRDHQLRIDQILTEEDLPYQYLTLDSFPSSQALLMAHERSREIRMAALKEIYGIFLKSKSILPKVVKAGGRLAPNLARWLGTHETKEFPGSFNELDPETDPTPEAVQEFAAHDQEQPFYMMNLNRFAPRKDRRYLSGKSAYKRYSAWITPYLISVGGYPVIFDKPLGTYIGDQGSSLSKSWSEFGLVYYPSRASFLRLMTNTPRQAVVYRRAGLEKAVLMACVQDRFK